MYKLVVDYEKASGQLVNYDKSLIYFRSNVKEDDRALVGGILGARVSSNPKNYLGLPMMVRRNKRRVFAYYVDKIRE